MKAIGITATDTEFGKTVVSSCLTAGFKYLGFDMGVFKPAASGCVRTAEGRLVSEDAELLIKGAGLTMAQHDEVVPYVLEAALAPAEASKLAGVKLEPAVMKKAAAKMISSHELTVVEGVGGISAPLTDNYLVKDFFCDMKGIRNRNCHAGFGHGNTQLIHHCAEVVAILCEVDSLRACAEDIYAVLLEVACKIQRSRTAELRDNA